MANTPTPTAAPSKPAPKPHRPLPRYVKLLFAAGLVLIVVFIVSITLMIKSNERSEIDMNLTTKTSENYGGTVAQPAPRLNAIAMDSAVYTEMENEYKSQNLTWSLTVARQLVQNANLISTDGKVNITLDMRKRGLKFEPTYKTQFDAKYVLDNPSNKKVPVQFEFPFPSNMQNKEINGAMLIVNGKKIVKPVRRTKVTTRQYDTYGNYIPGGEDVYKTGLYWEGTIPAGQRANIDVKYNTIGLSTFSYEGIENPEGGQDFKFQMKIIGSRKYDNLGALSIDGRKYIEEGGRNGVILDWNKPDLFSKPYVQVEVAPRVNPSVHLYEIYKIMVPLYIAFAVSIIILVSILKKDFGGVDMLIMGALFTVFFPLLHYLVSFNIDPSADVLANYAKAVDFSMPLYGAFAISLGVIGGLMVYMFARVSGKKFAFTVGLPLVIVYLAFFPLAMTLPEYKYLLALIGVVAILGIIVQLRVSRSITRVQVNK